MSTRSEIPWWRLERLARSLGVWVAEPVMYTGRRGKIEYAVHEITHVVSLRLPLEWGMQDAIGKAIHRRTYRVRFMVSRADGHGNEALCLAAEAAILPRLGIPVTHEELGYAAETQGVPTHTFLRAMRSRAARRLAERVMSVLSEAA